jgi:hypothetical protein
MRNMKYELFLIKYLYFNTKGLYLKPNLNIHYSNFSSVKSLIQQKNRLKYYINTYNKNNVEKIIKKQYII